MSREIHYIKIEESPLYGLNRRRDLGNLFGIAPPELNALRGDENFAPWMKEEEGKKPRLIEEPLAPLGAALAKLQGKLSVIETPAYFMSGKKGISPRHNAEAHKEAQYMKNIDIEKCFPSTKRELVYSMFKRTFNQSDDVASCLADMTTLGGHIATGTSVAQLLAFWTYRQTFDRIFNLCQQKGIRMTVWVDDITFSSGRPFPKGWVKDIKNILAKVDLVLKESKTKSYAPRDHKAITGTALSPKGELKVKNAKRVEIMTFLKARRVEDLSLKEARQLFGKLIAQRQNEPEFFDQVYRRCRDHIRKLDKAEAANKLRAKHRRPAKRAPRRAERSAQKLSTSVK